MPRLRHLLTLLPLTLAAALAQAEDLPAPIKQIEAKGAKIIGKFDAPSGLTGYAAQYQNRGMALYLTADGKNVIAGNLYDAQGNDLSTAPLEKLVYAPMAKEVWAKMENSSWIQDGDKNAPRTVYLFSDPNCPYCNMFWEQARPWVKAGKVQLRHVMVGVIREDSPAKAAARRVSSAAAISCTRARGVRTATVRDVPSPRTRSGSRPAMPSCTSRPSRGVTRPASSRA